MYSNLRGERVEINLGKKLCMYTGLGFELHFLILGSLVYFQNDALSQPLTSVGYAEWMPNEPNDASGNEDCVHIYKIKLQLNDVSCDTKLPFICILLSWIKNICVTMKYKSPYKSNMSHIYVIISTIFIKSTQKTFNIPKVKKKKSFFDEIGSNYFDKIHIQALFNITNKMARYLI
uniref:C-type lectin domain-containing protein n=1 Tax=Timema tahoe TaxID=61484 RepID=A0A7R9FEP8_9NEOP|nr:unnamed protein product [Timema tahoe]